MSGETVAQRRERARVTDATGSSTCERCRLPWHAVERIAEVKLDAANGCFALCGDCWADLDDDARLVYLRTVHEVCGWAESDWPLIEAAVQAGRVTFMAPAPA